MKRRTRVALCLSVGLGACGPAGPSAEAQRVRGDALYRAHCHACHDVEGAIGVALSTRVLASYGSARNFYDYLRMAMPYQAPGSLAQDEYWDIVAFALTDRGLVDAEVAVSAESADSLTFGSVRR